MPRRYADDSHTLASGEHVELELFDGLENMLWDTATAENVEGYAVERGQIHAPLIAYPVFGIEHHAHTRDNVIVDDDGDVDDHNAHNWIEWFVREDPEETSEEYARSEFDLCKSMHTGCRLIAKIVSVPHIVETSAYDEDKMIETNGDLRHNMLFGTPKLTDAKGNEVSGASILRHNL